MKPALSVIFFTVSSGAGLGLFVLLVLADLTGFAGPFADRTLMIGGAIALTLVAAGLLSSTMHLANPKNAWRSFARFRSSWLSREAVFALGFFAVALVYLGCVWTGADGVLRAASGVLALVLAWVVLYCTGMIYACLKPVPHWRTPLVPAAYLALGHFAGGLIFLALSLDTADSAAALRSNAVVLVLLAISLFIKGLYYAKFRVPGTGYRLNRAIGATAASVKLLDAGHSHGTFLTREFVFELARSRARLLRWSFLVASFALPLAFLILSLSGAARVPAWGWSGIALVAFIGLLIERWLFFAEAQHVVRLYHGQQAV